MIHTTLQEQSQHNSHRSEINPLENYSEYKEPQNRGKTRRMAATDFREMHNVSGYKGETNSKDHKS